MPIASNFEERWPAEKALFELGFTMEEVAHIIGWSSTTIRTDLRKRGGMKQLFPSRPTRPRDRYAKRFEAYANTQYEPISELWKNTILPALEAALCIAALEEFEHGLWAGVDAMMFPDLVESAAYNLLASLFGSTGRTVDLSSVLNPIGRKDMLGKLLDQVASNSEASPGNLQEVKVLLTRAVRLHSDRRLLRAPMPKGIEKEVEEALQSLTSRERFVTRHLSGFVGPRKTLSEVGALLELSRERIRQIEAKALRKLRARTGLKKFLGVCIEDLQERIKLQERELQIAAEDCAELRDAFEATSRYIIEHAGAETLHSLEGVPDIVTDISVYFRRMDEFELSVRSANCLQNAGIEYIYQIAEKTEIDFLKTRNFGRKSLNEIKELLAELGLKLGTPVPPRVRNLLAKQREHL